MQFATLAKREGNWSRNLSRNCFRGTRRSVPSEQRLHFRCVSWRAKSSLFRQPFNSIQKWSGRINEKNEFFPVLDRFRALRKSCVADQKLSQFFYIPAKLAPFDDRHDDYFCLRIAWRISRMHDRKLNGCRQRLLFARQLTQRKSSLCSQGSRSAIGQFFPCPK